MRFLLIVVFILLSTLAPKAQGNPQVWTAKYEQGFYKYLDSLYKSVLPDSIKRLKYLSFMIKRFKEEVPNGFYSVSKDSLHNLDIRVGREYAIKEKESGDIDPGIVPHFEVWTPFIEKTFRDDFLAVFKNREPKTVNDFCDCIIIELKKVYKDSILVPVPKEIMTKAAIKCRDKTGIN